MEYKDLKLRKATQFICVHLSIQYRYYRNAGEKITDHLSNWLKRVQDGTEKPDEDGYLETPYLGPVECKGDKDLCQDAAYGCRLDNRMYKSTSRLVQLGLWGDSWRVLPADENGNWVPSRSLINKILREQQTK